MFFISENKIIQYVVCYDNNKVYKNDTKFTKKKKGYKKRHRKDRKTKTSFKKK